jgi:hypothetical protein
MKSEHEARVAGVGIASGGGGRRVGDTTPLSPGRPVESADLCALVSELVILEGGLL